MVGVSGEVSLRAPEDEMAARIILWTLGTIIVLGLCTLFVQDTFSVGRDTVRSLAEKAGRCGTTEDCDKAVRQLYRFYEDKMGTGPSMMNWCLGATVMSWEEPRRGQTFTRIYGNLAFWFFCPDWLRRDGWGDLALRNAFTEE